MQTVEYAPGRLADVFGEPSQPTVLLWHGMQSDARSAVRTLAGLVAARGPAVVAPDWDAQADDNGRDDLLRSARFAAQRAGHEALVVVGWSMGGLAAAGLTINASRLDTALRHTVCLAGAFTATDPIATPIRYPARYLRVLCRASRLDRRCCCCTVPPTLSCPIPPAVTSQQS